MSLDVRKAEIEDHKSGFLAQHFQRGLAVGRFNRLIALRAETHAQKFPNRRLVIDDQDS